jgi:hypothetical protein
MITQNVRGKCFETSQMITADVKDHVIVQPADNRNVISQLITAMLSPIRLITPNDQKIVIIQP